MHAVDTASEGFLANKLDFVRYVVQAETLAFARINVSARLPTQVQQVQHGGYK
jgi:hypothetical protein